VFGRRKREEAAAAEAAREAERRALFAKLAERPEHICPFLGLADDRAGYVDGVSDEHRCFAFGDPAPLSAEQQTRVCQERGYGNCPRYLRGVLVIPTEELEALRRPRAPLPEPVVVPAGADDGRRRRAPLLAILALLLLVGAGTGAAFLFLDLDGQGGVAGEQSPSPTTTAQPTPTPSLPPTEAPTPSATAVPTSAPPSATPSVGASPTPEPTPVPGDRFAFYEVSVSPGGYLLFMLNGSGQVIGEREASFGGYSFARVEPGADADGRAYWRTIQGGLFGWSYRYPDSGDFRIRAVFLNPNRDRRSQYLDESALDQVPVADPTPAPSP
jgi:hypothetical protein